MTDILYCDLETYSETDLKSAATHNYADNAEVMLFSYALNDAPVKTWDLTTGAPMPKDLANALYNPDVLLMFHNSAFDRTVLRRGNLHINLPVERFRDSMVQAMVHGLPGGLEKVGMICGLSEEQAKIKEGKQLVMLFCKPRPAKQKLRRATRETHPEEWAKFITYAERDVDAMRTASRKLPMWNYRGTELALWHLDQRINDRGFQCDVELARKAIAAAAAAQAALRDRVRDETEGQVSSATKRDQLLKYILEEHGVTLPDLTADTLKRRLEDPELPDAVKLLISIRLEAGMASSSKYKALVNAVSPDGRLRNTLQFAGAMRTSRWAGRVFQPQNMKRPDMKQDAIDLAVEAIKADCLDLTTTEPMRELANAVRGCIIAPPGKKLCIADLSNIEGRKLAWLAGEEWKLKAFADFDRGIGNDMYKVAFARAFNKAPEAVTKDERQQGKVMELACLAGDTPVLTNNGIKAIKEVLVTDLLWDGMEWIRHQGLVERGVKPVVRVANIELTPDHLILTGRRWRQAQELVSNASTLSRALATASVNLPSWVCSVSDKVPATSTLSKCSAPAERSPTRSTQQTYALGAAHGATCAQKSSQHTGAKTSGHMQTLFPMTNTADGYSTASQRVSPGAITQKTTAIQTTAVEAFTFTNLGESAVALFWHTLSRSKAGTTRCLSWIGKMSTRATSQATCASSPSEKTKVTAAPSESCSNGLLNSKPVYDILNAGPRNRFTVITTDGPLIVHNCGYEGGVGAFLTFAAVYQMDLDALSEAVWTSASKEALDHATGMYNWTVKKKRSTFGLTREVWIACEVLKALWREAHPNVVNLWADAASAIRSAFRTPGVVFTVGKHIKVQRDGIWTRVRLPSGRYVCYLDVQVAEGGEISYMGINQYTRQWSRIKTYGGKLCIAEGSLVLAKRGWTKIEEITSVDQVWDGVEWVATSGAVCNGEKEVVNAYGAEMTHDHEVLTEAGWKHASQSKRFNRAACRLPDGVVVPGQRWEEVDMGNAVRLREAETDGGVGVFEATCQGHSSVVRLPQERNDTRKAHNARDEQAPGVCGVAVNAGPVPTTYTSSVAQLRGAWHNGLRKVAGIVRELLAGHGADVPARPDTGARGQRPGLRTEQLSVGDVHRASKQSTQHANGERSECSATSGEARRQALHDVLPTGAGRECGPVSGTAKRVTKVYDLVNCGPRHRFVIAAGGLPLIVHNCENWTQASARDVMADRMPHIDASGYEIVLSVHDELLTETPDTDEYSSDALAAMMATNPAWATGLPLAAAGFETTRYRKD